jgi:hypothetical protein
VEEGANTMKKQTMLLLLALAALCAVFSGCGKEAGIEFVGTWKYDGFFEDGHFKKDYEEIYVIEKAQNGDTNYIVTKYRLENITIKSSGEIILEAHKKQFPAQYKDGILEKDFSEKYYIEDGKLKTNVAEETYERVSDKSMTFEEMDNGRGYPAPK